MMPYILTIKIEHTKKRVKQQKKNASIIVRECESVRVKEPKSEWERPRNGKGRTHNRHKNIVRYDDVAGPGTWGFGWVNWIPTDVSLWRCQVIPAQWWCLCACVWEMRMLVAWLARMCRFSYALRIAVWGSSHRSHRTCRCDLPGGMRQSTQKVKRDTRIPTKQRSHHYVYAEFYWRYWWIGGIFKWSLNAEDFLCWWRDLDVTVRKLELIFRGIHDRWVTMTGNYRR